MANIKPSQGVFCFKGVSSADMGVLLLELPSRPTAAPRGESVDVKGRDGKLWIPEGTYERITVKCKMESAADADFDAINAWLDGEGDLVFGDEPDRAYHARVVKGSERTHKSPRRINRTWTQQWECEPFRYEAQPAAPIALDSSGVIVNPGTVESQPLLKLTCEGDGQIMIGGVNAMLVQGFTGVITVDCEAKVAYQGDGSAQSPFVLLTHKLTGEWAVIPPGTQAVSFTAGITHVEIEPRWRWL